MTIPRRTLLESVSPAVATDPSGCVGVRSCQIFRTPCKFWLTSSGDDRIVAVNRANAVTPSRRCD
jgi:hypothetical protein